MLRNEIKDLFIIAAQKFTIGANGTYEVQFRVGADADFELHRFEIVAESDSGTSLSLDMMPFTAMVYDPAGCRNLISQRVPIAMLVERPLPYPRRFVSNSSVMVSLFNPGFAKWDIHMAAFGAKVFWQT